MARLPRKTSFCKKKIILLVCWSFSDVIVQEGHYAAHLSHPRSFPYLPGKIILSADLSILLKWITWTYKHAVNDEKFRTGYYANRVSTWKKRCVVKFKYDARHRFKIDYGTRWSFRTMLRKKNYLHIALFEKLFYVWNVD